MKKFFRIILLFLFVVSIFGCSYMKTDLGDSEIDVEIISIYGKNGKTKGLKLSFNKVPGDLDIKQEINGDTVLKLSFENVNKMSSLNSISIPDTVIEIDTFEGSSIKEIKLPAELKVLPSFRSCDGISEIDIPSGVEKLPNYGFIGCKKLTSITFNSIEPPVIEKESPFPNNNSLIIYVPVGSEDIYKEKWNMVDWKTIGINGPASSEDKE